jgi:hypothetical protein
MTYNLQNSAIAAFAAILSSAVFVAASIGPAITSSASLIA